jgi:tetratricopeptide (TPR) repeat protein
MNAPPSIDERVAALGRTSRQAALVSLLGFLLVLGALFYAATELTSLERERKRLDLQRSALLDQIERDKAELAKVNSELANARQAVAASRLAINAFHAGRLEDAVALYDEALRADPSNAYLQNLRAYALFRLGHVDAALEGQRKSVASDPQYAWGYFDLARFLCAASPSRLEEAKDAASRALKLRPDLRRIMEQDAEFQRVCHGQIPGHAP